MRLIGKYLNILDYAISLLLRHKMKNLNILIVFSMVIFLIASFQLVTSALNELSDTLLTEVPDITIQQMSGGRQVALQTQVVQKLAGIYGIANIRTRIWGYYFDEKNGANYTVIGLDKKSIDPSITSSLQWGRLPLAEGEVVLAGPVVTSMRLGERKNFSLFRPDLSMQSFKTVGVFARSTAFVTDDLLFMSLSDAAGLFDIKDGYVTDLLISVGNPEEVDTIAKKIADNLPGTRVLTQGQIRKTYDVVFSWRSGVGSICLLTSIFAFIILAWDRASGLSAEEKREVGILKITGWQASDVMLLRFCESSVISSLAFLLGYSCAWAHVTMTNAILLRPVLLGWSVLQPSYTFLPPLLLSDFLLIFVCSFVPYLAATIVPAWRSGAIRAETVI